MRLYVIGKLISNNKTIAYKIYDSDSKESKIIATKDIMKAMANCSNCANVRTAVAFSCRRRWSSGAVARARTGKVQGEALTAKHHGTV